MGLAIDLVFEGGMQAFHEQRHFIRQLGRVMFDTSRLAQTGFWSGTLQVGDESFRITPDRWWGTRDRSWGVRPVGEAEPPGIRATTPVIGGLWSYAPMQFRDFSIMYICQESGTGERALEEAVRIPALGRPGKPELLGRPEFDFEFVSGTRRVKRARLHLMRAERTQARDRGRAAAPDVRRRRHRLRLRRRLAPRHVPGTPQGRGILARHARPREPGAPVRPDRQRGALRAGRAVGYGLFEYLLMGPNARFGFKSFEDVAP